MRVHYETDMSLEERLRESCFVALHARCVVLGNDPRALAETRSSMALCALECACVAMFGHARIDAIKANYDSNSATDLVDPIRY